MLAGEAMCHPMKRPISSYEYKQALIEMDFVAAIFSRDHIKRRSPLWVPFLI